MLETQLRVFSQMRIVCRDS